MRGRLLGAALTALSMCVATACGAAGAGSTAASGVAARTLAARGLADTRLGTDVGRHTVHSVDVNGDGRPDRVTIRWEHLVSATNHEGMREVTVSLASGPTVRRSVRALGWFGSHFGHYGWAGSVHFPGTTGRQIVLVTDAGAADTFFEVLAYMHGRLKVIEQLRPNRSSYWDDGGSVGTGGEDAYCTHRAMHSVAFLYSTGRDGQTTVHVRDLGYIWRRGWLAVTHYDGRQAGDPASQNHHEFTGCHLHAR